LYKLSQYISNFDQNNHIPILICIEYDSRFNFLFKPFLFSDIRDGAIICLIANLMEQLMIDNTVDIYHQARKIAYSCSAFQTEV
jgi:hypothetical protein